MIELYSLKNNRWPKGLENILTISHSDNKNRAAGPVISVGVYSCAQFEIAKFMTVCHANLGTSKETSHQMEGSRRSFRKLALVPHHIYH